MTAVEFLQAQFDKHLYYVEGYYNAKPYTLQDLVNDFDTALAMERTATCKEEQLQQRIKELENQITGLVDNVTMLSDELEEEKSKQGKFAEWASGCGWHWVYTGDQWHRYGMWGVSEFKTTSELWAEWNRCGSI